MFCTGYGPRAEDGAKPMRKKNPYRFVRNVVLYIALVWLVGQAVSVYDHRSHVRAEECVTKYGC